MEDRSIDKTVRMTEVIKILLDNAPVVNTEEEKTKYILESIRKLKDAGITFDVNDPTPDNTPENPSIANYRQDICQAIEKGDPERLEALIEEGADIDQFIDANGNTPLHMAAVKGQMECMRILFSAGADPYIKNNENENPVETFRSIYPEKYSEYKERIVNLTGIELKETVSLELGRQ